MEKLDDKLDTNLQEYTEKLGSKTLDLQKQIIECI